MLKEVSVICDDEGREQTGLWTAPNSASVDVETPGSADDSKDGMEISSWISHLVCFDRSDLFVCLDELAGLL